MTGWNPATVTQFRYDDTGRVVGMESYTESEWSPDQVALLLAARELRNERGPHGFSMLEATDPKNQFAFVGKGPRTDWAEKARLDAQDAYFKQWDKANRNGMTFVVTKRDK